VGDAGQGTTAELGDPHLKLCCPKDGLPKKLVPGGETGCCEINRETTRSRGKRNILHSGAGTSFYYAPPALGGKRGKKRGVADKRGVFASMKRKPPGRGRGRVKLSKEN